MSAATIRKMLAAGLSIEQALTALEVMEAEGEARLAKKRADNAERQRRFKAKKNADNALSALPSVSDVTGVTDPSPSPPRDIINPPNPTPSTSLRSVEPRAKRASVANAAAESFNRFWEAWPNRVAKRDAAKAFLKVHDEIDAILDGVARYVASKPADREWMHPATFLNGRRWEDAPAPSPQPSARAGPFQQRRDPVIEAGLSLMEEYGFAENRPEFTYDGSECAPVDSLDWHSRG